jgi:hypothetical protein
MGAGVVLEDVLDEQGIPPVSAGSGCVEGSRRERFFQSRVVDWHT